MSTRRATCVMLAASRTVHVIKDGRHCLIGSYTSGHCRPCRPNYSPCRPSHRMSVLSYCY